MGKFSAKEDIQKEPSQKSLRFKSSLLKNSVEILGFLGGSNTSVSSVFLNIEFLRTNLTKN
jgi:hypothetical protein